MDWIIFGDQWHGFPTATRHIVDNLAREDKILWINGLPLCGPELGTEDIRRLWGEAAQVTRKKRSSTREQIQAVLSTEARRMSLVDLDLLPWHLCSPARRSNRMAIHREIQWEIHHLAMKKPVVLVVNPVAGFYLDGLDVGPVIYYRTGQYDDPLLSDPELMQAAEARILSRCDLVLAAEERLIPHMAGFDKPTLLFPCGVDTSLLNHVSEMPPNERILGFLDNTVAGLDYLLIESAAKRLPNWTFDLAVPAESIPAKINSLSNVHCEDIGRYALLPERISTWKAAWLPLEAEWLHHPRTQHLAAQMNATGLATALPGVVRPWPDSLPAAFLEGTEQLAEWLDWVERVDTEQARRQRKTTVSHLDWRNKVEQIYVILEQLFQKKTPVRKAG